MLKTDYAQWIGKTQTVEGGVSADVAAMLQATLTPRTHTRAGVLPHLWHWAAFTPKVAMDQVSSDGHPVRGDFLPPIPLARRMWAGGHVTFHAPLGIATQLRQVSQIADVQEKSDTMVFVKIQHDTYDGATLAISEVQNIVYLQIPDAFSPPNPIQAPETSDFCISSPMSEARLFRYSAATFNAHRIHYDLPYAQGVEKYPGLVVHGPLQATLLLDAAVAHTGRTPARFGYRGVYPMFHTNALHLMGQTTDDGMSICTAIPGAHQGMQATVTWKDTQ